MTYEQEQKLRGIIKKIQNTRTTNNQNWMRILELAVIYAPEQVLECMKGVRDCDDAIQRDFVALVDELEKVVK